MNQDLDINIEYAPDSCREAALERAKQDRIAITHFAAQTKAAGYQKPRINNTWNYCEAIAMDTKRGVAIGYTRLYHPPALGSLANRPDVVPKDDYILDKEIFGILIRGAGAGNSYRASWVGPAPENYNSVEEAIAAAKDLKGSAPKKRTKTKVVWRTPNPDSYTRVGNGLRRNNCIASAEVLGFCSVDDHGKIIMDAANPDSDGFVVAKCHDYQNRKLFVLLNGSRQFLLGTPRGSSMFLTDDKVLFTDGKYPFDIETKIQYRRSGVCPKGHY